MKALKNVLYIGSNKYKNKLENWRKWEKGKEKMGKRKGKGKKKRKKWKN